MKRQAHALDQAQIAAMFGGERLAISRDWEERFAAGQLPTLLDRRAAREAGMFDESSSGASDLYDRVGNVGVVSISGALMQHGGGWWFDGHDAIRSRIKAAIGDGISVLALCIDSPGGVVAGTFDNVRGAIADIQAAGVKCLAWCGGNGAFSGGYAWACAASSISIPDTGGVGSVGVLGVLVDRTKQNDIEGVRRTVVRSGERKAEGHPDVPTTDGAIAREQAIVDDQAGIFASVVSASRMSADGTSGAALTPESVLAMQGESYYGVKAIDSGLADRIESWDQFMARCQATAEGMSMKAMNGRLGLAADASEERAIQVYEAQIADRDSKVKAAELAATEAKSAAARAETERQALATEYLEYAKQDVLISGKATAATIDADMTMLDGADKSRAARAFVARYASVPRGAALPKETPAPVAPPATVGPAVAASRAAVAAVDPATLDGSKMTMTEIGAHYGTEHFDRLVNENARANASKDAAMFARINLPGRPLLAAG